MTIGVAWYAHLPAISSVAETRRHVESSLLPLFDVHVEHRTPFLLAPTGSFLELATSYRPQLVDEMRHLEDDGLLEIAATFFHEVWPLELTLRRARRHLREDLTYKSARFTNTPRWFVPANFAWRVGFGDLLVRLGMDAVLLDSRHAVAAGQTHHWEWGDAATSPAAVVSEPGDVQPYETQRVRQLECPGSTPLTVVFRDWDLVRAVTFGNDSVLATGVDPRGCPTSELSALSREDPLHILCDDVDRIRGETISTYRKLVGALGSTFAWDPGSPRDTMLPRFSTLPTWNIPGLASALLDWDGGRDWSALAREVREVCSRAPCVEATLWLDDAFALFWRQSSRRNRYVAEACRYLHTHYEGGHVGVAAG